MTSARTTVVIATRDRWDELRHTLHRLAELDPAPPVVVVDNGSSDGTRQRLPAEFPQVRLIPLSGNRGATARNHGVAVARTPYVAFSDDDSWWAPGALQQAERLFDACPRLGVVSARTLVGPEQRLDPLSAELAASPLGREPGLPGVSVLGFLACAAIVRREAFLACGGFSPVLFFPGEEQLLSWDLAAAGWALCHVPELVAHHHPSRIRPPSAARRRLQARNALLTVWLRRPWPEIAAATGAQLRAGELRVLLAALARLPGVLRARRRLPAEVEQRLALLQRQAWSAPGRVGQQGTTTPQTVEEDPCPPAKPAP
ncbi:glycosyltransferase [Crossiella sp. CA-258035]|uniref:glycosyltransferase family 2 protein n=1 Tax=Crossiella sp. CA-258035 TaxID=2981138 RepID=UPI0024BC0FE4|nr:glycosyltransferase [Crossiella sp. CA-258035]WHT15939.1 glycosyltransferase [Crossiella sp. CA-258035]